MDLGGSAVIGTLWGAAVWIARGGCCLSVACLLMLALGLLWGNGVRTLGEPRDRWWRP